MTMQERGRLTRDGLADAIEEHGSRALELIVGALRDQPRRAPADVRAAPVSRQEWRHEGTVVDFEHQWPDVHEHYSTLQVYATVDEVGPVHMAWGAPRETMSLYGRDRGWVSVWEVVNGQPREQRAVFVDADDFAVSGDRVALISGKDGSKRALYLPGDRHLLPATYDGRRVEVHRNRCSGPYAKNRLAVVAKDSEVEVMLDHALHHLRLRT